MSETEREHRVATLLADVGDEVAGYVRPAGAAAVLTTVRRRRRRRAVAGGVLAVVLLALPATALVLSGRGGAPAPEPGTSVAPTAPGPTTTGPSTPVTPSGPVGRIPAAELADAT